VSPDSVALVRVERTGLEESVHHGDVAVVDAGGRLVAFAGDPERRAFARSSMKPLQAVVSLSLSSFDYPDREASVMCASHNAEPVHVEAVRSMLARSGVSETALLCPAVLPLDQESMLAAPERLPVNSDCSGKHAGMLGAAREQGWPLESYREPEHPLQSRVLDAVRLASGEGTFPVGVDGCGVPVHGLPLRAMATIYARLTSPDRLGELEPSARLAVGAMRAEPYMVAGRNRVDTAVMEAVDGVIVKSGAEGMICAGLLNLGLGVAVKVRDGSHRAAGPALIRALALLDGVGDEALDGVLEPHASPPVLGGGRPVGRMRSDFDLVRP
jgi:L-asparaginase II